MRIGILLRSMDDPGGIGVYTRNLTQGLIELGSGHQFVLFYQDPAKMGHFADEGHVTERLVTAGNKILWDQVAIPRACRQEGIDVLLHPKFTVPLVAPCKTVMVLHGVGWFLPEFSHYWSFADRTLARLTMPLYCQRASAMISVSQITSDVYNRLFHLPPGKVRTVYSGPAKHFRRVEDRDALEQVRAKYHLPERFIFSLSGYDRGDRKNISGIFQAFARHHGKTPHKLVIGGRGCETFRTLYHLPEDGYGRDILFPGWMDQADLPAIYSLADAFLYPSNLEAFPVPVIEAMTCGTPVITSDANGLKEIAGEAALLVNPKDPQDIAGAVHRVLSDAELRASLSAKGLARVAMFNWDRCAREVLTILESLG